MLPKLRMLTLRMQCALLCWWERRSEEENRKPRIEDRNSPPLSALSLITFDRQEFFRALFSLAPTLEIVGLNINEMPQGMSPIDEQVQRTDVVDA